jgi:hypothetical protein
VAKSGKKKRQQLFDLLARNLSQLDPTQHDCVVCPLCLTVFGRDALEAEQPVLTLAHVVPNALGGTACTLTCAACNNGNGHTLEAILVEQFEDEDWAAGMGRKSGRMAGEFGDVGVEVETPGDGSGTSIYLIGPQSDRRVIAVLQEIAKNSPQNGFPPFSLIFGGRSADRPCLVKNALLQSAYLAMFRQFGYDFVCHPHFRNLREQIRNPREAIWDTRIWILEEASVCDLLADQRQAVMFLSDPRAIFVLLRLRTRTGRQRIIGVGLPGLDDPAVPDVSSQFGGTVFLYDPQALTQTGEFLRDCWDWNARNGDFSSPN